MATLPWAIDREEVLRYLGYRGGALPPEIGDALSRCEELLQETARPRTTWRLFSLEEDGSLAGTAFRPQGQVIARLLRDCRQVILMGATLGAEVETLLRRLQSRDMADAVILDACASAAIESVCDSLCEEIASAVAPSCLTDRYSPGYGDFPLSQQSELCRVLDLPRRIGVHLTEGALLLPQKTVTALIGVAETPQPMRIRGCGVCQLSKTCAYRKEGKRCESF